jgi:hypothetical protein
LISLSDGDIPKNSNEQSFMITCRNSGEEDKNVSDIQRQVGFGKEVKIYRPVGGWGSYL